VSIDAQIPARSCRNTASVDEGAETNGSAYGRNETAGRRIGVWETKRRIGTLGAVGLRSRATGVARQETSLC